MPLLTFHPSATTRLYITSAPTSQFLHSCTALNLRYLSASVRGEHPWQVSSWIIRFLLPSTGSKYHIYVTLRHR